MSEGKQDMIFQNKRLNIWSQFSYVEAKQDILGVDEVLRGYFKAGMTGFICGFSQHFVSYFWILFKIKYFGAKKRNNLQKGE